MKKLSLITFLPLFLFFASCQKKELNVDFLIKNGTVYNGVDSLPNHFSIGIKDDKIVYIGDDKNLIIHAVKTIDATGLFYSPGSYSDTEELIELAKVVAKNNGIYDSHIRDEGSYSIGLKGAIEEEIEIGRQAKLPIHIAHIKCLGADVWNQSKDIIELIEKSKSRRYRCNCRPISLRCIGNRIASCNSSTMG